MPVQYGIKRKILPTAILGGRVALAHVDDVAIMITNVDKWTDADVIKLLEESAHLGGRITAPGAITHFLGETLGGAASQRKMIVEWMEKNNIDPTPRTITLTDSALMRAALTAYSWITKTEMKAFASKDLVAACTWLTRDMDTRADDVRAAVEGCYKLLKKTV
ncbi:MAG TPA: hypothetical protein VLB90_10665 [Pseudomonadales bacterium]|nr:hypothetical protein [Pseudomonadales bacterium]